MRWRNIRYQTKLLILFVVLSCFPALMIGTIGYQRSADTLRMQNLQNMDLILGQLKSSIERRVSDFDRFSMLPYYMPNIFSFLNTPYASVEQWGSKEISAQRTMVRLISAYPSINASIQGLVVYGMNGTITGYRLAGETQINRNEKVQESDWYREVMEAGGGFVVTGLNEIRQFNGPSSNAIIGARMLRDEEFRPLAVIAMFISPEFISNIVRSQEFRNLEIMVLDKQNNMIYASEEQLAKRLLTSGIQPDGKGEWQTRVKSDAGDKTFVGVYQRSDYLGWNVYIGIDRDEMLAGSRSIRNFTALIIVVVACLAVMLSWLLARGLSKPISQLIRSMRAVERGQFLIPKPHVRGDEIGQLESSYGRMVKRLHDLIQTIEEKERQKRHSELYALRARIQPHFLYNTLNSIRMLAILQQSTQIAKLIHSLNKLLQANMKLDTELVTLQEEVELLKSYASLMDLRYTNVFEVEWRIPERVLQAAIPPMLLQPLVENAIFHGAQGLNRKLSITVEARLEDYERILTVEIRDDGRGFSKTAGEPFRLRERSPGSGNIGLRNVQDRIRLRFGEEYGLTVGRTDRETVITIRMPYRLLEKELNRHVEPSGGGR
ncbi:histidine kinase [Paenibacillus sp. 32O-W]|uniref:sensor histidine kinase n=1 Tax=Paenibacillus sp. 32O-W TaxID=1695218 RepID=UPI00071EBE03|nr:sensor histidine kinase [Paenibacillus sp. 32O-W]ALS28569.1 histidine kinase [Paenibacillus sp. 32O-W]